MDLDSTFSVTAPIDKVYATLMDFEKVAGCVPGAQVLNKLSEDAYQVGMKVKLGPVTMQYKGQMEVVERDPAGHRAVLKGTAKEARGQGTAEATAELSLKQDGDQTLGTVHADLALSGKVAAMGKSVIGSVTDQMMAQFAANLQAMLNEPESIGVPDADLASAVPDAEAFAKDLAAEAEAPLIAPTPAAVRPAAHAQPAESSLDALTLGRAVVLEQLRDPKKAAWVALLVLFLVYRLGRRAGRRAS